MQKLPEDGNSARIVLVGIEIPVIEVRAVFVRVEVERIIRGLPQFLFFSFHKYSPVKQLN